VWEVFSGEDIDGLTDCITDYINFCVESTVPTRTVRCFSNGKPWVSPEIKALLKEKKRVFRTGNRENLRTVQRELRMKIREGKDIYRKRMEDQLQQNDISGVWKGLKAMSGFKGPNQQPVGDQQWVNELNLFYNRFDQPSTPSLTLGPLRPPLPPCCCNPHHLHPLWFTPRPPPPPLHLSHTHSRTSNPPPLQHLTALHPPECPLSR